MTLLSRRNFIHRIRAIKFYMSQFCHWDNILNFLLQFFFFVVNLPHSMKGI